ncbi:hypothetical protein QE412_001812 [Microbacterium trichothecenolyticum]|uniref:Uncharacterized protein n=1 Tax=Microbacterium trichothecenolyticum TaxID=69370 RepID=A0ABU0TUC2_MICTR|nr:hypothetical protein [Microbacterium trichothecenolyticum]MDQ1123239.1 hypothetical protein [Microbacterium trichothecenolyticum]
MQIGMEHAIDEDLLDHRRHEDLGEAVALVAAESGQTVRRVAQSGSVDELHRQYALTRCHREHLGHADDTPPVGLGSIDEVESRADHPGVAGLDAIVQLLQERRREPPRDRLDAKVATDTGACLGAVCEPADDVGIRLDLRAGGGALDFHHDGRPVEQMSAVHLGHRRGGQRDGIDVGVDLADRCAQVGLDDRADGVPRQRGGVGLQRGERAEVGLGNEIAASGEDLPQLHEADTGVVDRRDDRVRALLGGAQVGLDARVTAVEEPPHAVARGNGEDLQVAARALALTQCRTDEVDGIGQRTCGENRLDCDEGCDAQGEDPRERKRDEADPQPGVLGGNGTPAVGETRLAQRPSRGGDPEEEDQQPDHDAAGPAHCRSQDAAGHEPDEDRRDDGGDRDQDAGGHGVSVAVGQPMRGRAQTGHRHHTASLPATGSVATRQARHVGANPARTPGSLSVLGDRVVPAEGKSGLIVSFAGS